MPVVPTAAAAVPAQHEALHTGDVRLTLLTGDFFLPNTRLSIRETSASHYTFTRCVTDRTYAARVCPGLGKSVHSNIHELVSTGIWVSEVVAARRTTPQSWGCI